MTIAGRAPSSASRAAMNAETGVFPVPPTLRFPTEIAGSASVCERSQPRSYAALRAATAAAYTRETGISAPRRIRVPMDEDSHTRPNTPSGIRDLLGVAHDRLESLALGGGF